MMRMVGIAAGVGLVGMVGLAFAMSKAGGAKISNAAALQLAIEAEGDAKTALETAEANRDAWKARRPEFAGTPEKLAAWNTNLALSEAEVVEMQARLSAAGTKTNQLAALVAKK